MTNETKKPAKASLKILMPEVLPVPGVAPPKESPRVRAQRRLEQLAKRAALAGAASSLSACIGFGVVDPLPPPPEDCAPDDDPSLWVNAFVQQLDPLIVQLITSEDFTNVLGVSIAANVEATGAIVSNVVVDEPNRQLTVTLDVNAGVTEVVLGINTACNGEQRPLEVVIDVVNGGAFTRDPS